MDSAAFEHMAATEATHWWFVGRRAVIDALLEGMALPTSGDILEAGCGTGGNLATLSRRGKISAFEPHIDALSFARTRHPDLDIREGSLPAALPYDLASFDLVAALDVLEHVDSDAESAQALVDLVRPGGWMLVTVPAHQALWGSHDRRLHHRRRYGRDQLLRLFEAADVDLVRFTPFNVILSPIALIYRVGERMLGLDLGNQERMPWGPLNAALGAMFRAESVLVRHGLPIPFGLSYAAVFRRRSASADGSATQER
jgi:SAM-dependent methyltransferase